MKTNQNIHRHVVAGTHTEDLQPRGTRKLKLLYQSASRMAGSDSIATLLYYLVEDLAEIVGLERMVVLFYDRSRKLFESKVFYGFDEVREEVQLPRREIRGLLRKVHDSRTPLNVMEPVMLASDTGQESISGKGAPVFPNGLGGTNAPQINLCLKVDPSSSTIDLPAHAGLQQYSVLTRYSHDGTVEALFGDSSSFVILPICDQNDFYGYVLGDKCRTGAPVTYDDVCLAMTIAGHTSHAVGRVKKQITLKKSFSAQQQKWNHVHSHMLRRIKEIEDEKGFYERIVQNLRSGLITVDEHMRIQHTNAAAEEILGYAPGTLLGKPFQSVICRKKNEDCIFGINTEELDSSTGHMAEVELIRKDGQHIPIEACFSTIQDGAREIVGLSCIFKDITQRKAREAYMARIDRLASLGELAAGVAHEIKNPLAGIAGALQILSYDFKNDDPNQEIFEEVFKQVKRLDGFVNNLLQFARPSTPDFKPLELEDVLNSVLFLVVSQIEDKQISLDVNFEKDQPPVQGDEALLQQVFLNIIMNALDAMEAQGTLTIHTCWDAKRRECGRLQCVNTLERSESDEVVRVVIRDTGCGIDAEALETIFNPFYTTKNKGTGLGLSISHRIIEQHRGSIVVESEPGKGTCFVISLPVFDSSQQGR